MEILIRNLEEEMEGWHRENRLVGIVLGYEIGGIGNGFGLLASFLEVGLPPIERSPTI